jgi:4-hydroxy-3-methylbut-2-enyl diphosphate reductase
VLERLEKKGVVIIDDKKVLSVGRFDGEPVIVRAHGVPPRVEKLLLERGAAIKDATCPKVKANQLLARQLEDKGYTIFLAGDKSHAEIVGILGYAPSCVCVQTATEVAAAAEAAAQALSSPILHPPSSILLVALIAQTTFSSIIYDEIASELKKFFPKLEVKNTICPATAERQTALQELCKKVDFVIIAGDKTSANTTALLAIAKNAGLPALIAESAADIPPLPESVHVVGIASGASTPPDVIEGIKDFIHRLHG